MWDVDFQTAVAQAEVEDRPTRAPSTSFASASRAAASFVIATTRPELLPACVGVAAHPDDARYRGLFGKRAVTPLFRVPVPIFPSELVDREKGTGILMVCTFGDATDVHWWREQKLRAAPDHRPRRPPRAGRVRDARPSRAATPAAANQAYARLAGKKVKEARKAIVELLRDPAAGRDRRRRAAARRGAAADRARRQVLREGRPARSSSSPRASGSCAARNKQELLEAGDQIAWHPDFMRLRFRNWTENLNLDWCISRQRYFGVPFPVWYPLRADGTPDFAAADRRRGGDALPVDPDDATRRRATRSAARPARRLHRRGRRLRHLVHELAHAADRERLDRRPGAPQAPFPADMRPQSHEIIRTWAFYTIAKALLHEGDDPLAARGDLGLDPRPRPQEDVEEQGQRGDADAPARPVRRRRRALLGARGAARHRHRLRREGA